MKQKLQKLLAEGKTAQVLVELQNWNHPDSDAKNLIRLLASRFATLEGQRHAGANKWSAK
jgi:hypothetical protein